MRRRLTPYLLVGPASLLLLAFGVLPLFVAAVTSTTDMDAAGLGDFSRIGFVGLANYRELFADPAFWQAMGNTLFYALIGVPSVVAISLAVALLLDRSNSRFFRALRSFYFLPAITGIVAIALVWGYLYNTQFGLLNYA